MRHLLVLLASPLLFSQTIPSAFRPVVSSRIPQWSDTASKVRRFRAVEMEASLFDDTAARASRSAAADAPRKTVDFNLFDGTVLRAEFDRAEYAGPSNRTIIWTGRIQNTQRGQIVMAVTGKIHAATLTTDTGNTYLIRQADSLVHWVMEGDASQLPPDGPPKRVAPGETGPAPRAPAAPDDGSTLDVLVVYTPAARAGAGGTAQMVNQIALGIAETNQGYANSGIIQRVRLAGTAEVNYTEASDMSVDLDRLTNTSDGFLDEVHPMRDNLHADLVSLWRSSGNYCGIAWLMTDTASNFAARAFSVVATNCATGYYSFGHEMGHNMGANHDVANAGGQGAFPYSYGYQQKTQSPFFRTVMAYACSGGVTCDRINYWSNPNNTYSGLATGTSATDNRTTLNNTRTISANWRTAAGGNSLSPTSASFTNAAGTGSITVTATGAWTAASGASWATITAGASGSGNGTVNYSVDANTTTSVRTTTLTIATQVFTIVQSGTSTCLVTSIGIPQTVSRTLSTSDCISALRPSRYAQRFTFNAAAGQQVAITLTSTAFDAYLYLLSPSGTTLTEDDDSAGNTDARIPAAGFYTLPSTGIYSIEVTTFDNFAVGAFTLSLTAPGGCTYSLTGSSASFNSNPGTGTITVNTSAGCTWNASSAASWISITSTGTTTGSGSATYSFTGNAGASSRTGTILVAGLTFTVTQAGLSSSCAAIPIAFGSTVNSTLSSTCTSLNRGANYYAARYAFDGTTGQQVAIALSSSAFDSYLYMVGPNGTVVAVDDDSGGGLNSRIPASGFFNLPQTGTYTIEATAFRQNSGGAFTLTLTGGCGYTVNPLSAAFNSLQSSASVALSTQAGCSWTASPNATWLSITPPLSGSGSATISYTAAANNTGAPRLGTLTVAGNTVTIGQAATSSGCPPIAISTGQTLSGNIATLCYATGRGTGYYASRYTFSGTSGQQVSIDLNSTAFDTYLVLIGPSGGVVATDDDGGPGVNSRIPANSGTFTLPATGVYTIEATTFALNVTGAFTLTLTLSGSGSLQPPVQIAPANGAAGQQATGLVLTWNASTGATSYDVYFSSQNPPLLAANVTSTSFAAGTLSPGTTYFWNIVAKNGSTNTSSTVWSFTTSGTPTPLQLVTVAPCRVFDSRNAIGALGGPFIGAGTTRAIPVSSSPCGIPATAAAYSLNITVVPSNGSLAFLTVWPTGQAQPNVSALNSFDGSILANAAIVQAGAGGSINAFAFNDTELIVDINGYFVPPTGNSLQFFPLTPCRVLDTRNANGTFGGPAISGGTSRTFPVPSSPCGAPANAAAYSLNVTAVPQGLLAFVTAFPAGQSLPNVSTLNSFDGTVLANAAIVPAGAAGAVSFFATNTTHLVADINGYFAPAGAGGRNFFTAAPCRLADTRNASGSLGGPILTGGSARTFPLAASACGLPAAAAYSLNMTVVPSVPLGYLTVWPTGQAQPFVSTLNAPKGLVVANAVLVPAGTSGSLDVFVTNSTHVIIDTNGYFQ